MKIILVALFLVSCSFYSLAQKKDAKQLFSEVEKEWKLDDNGNVSFTKVIDVHGVSKDELYARALSYFTYNYNNGDDVVQVKDKEEGLIIGKGIYGTVFVGGFLVVSTYNAVHIIRIDIKDGKARIILSIQEFRVKNRDANGGVSYPIFPVSERFPFVKDAMKKQVMKAIYETCQRVKTSFDKIEKSLKEDAAGTKAKDTEW